MSDPLCQQTDFRPRIIEGGYRTNPNPEPIKAGWPWVNNRWRIWYVVDGILTWHRGHDIHSLKPGQWVIHGADQRATHMMASPGCRWAQLRFQLFPSWEEGDPGSQAVWGFDLPHVLSIDQAEPFRPQLEAILAWWWRDPWYLTRAEALLGTMVVELVHALQPQTPQTPSPPDQRFAAVDDVLHSRPLAPIPDLAEACQMSERTFRRAFTAHRGTSPARYQRMIMARQACDMLRDKPSWSIERIARHLGYTHSSTFIRAFKAEVSKSPVQWRNGHPLKNRR